VDAAREHAAAAWMRDVQILLHHLAGAADLVADQRAGLRQQQIVHRALHPVAFGLIARRNVCRQRLQPDAVTPAGGDELCGGNDPVHAQRPSCPEYKLGRNVSTRQSAIVIDTPSELISKEKRSALQAARDAKSYSSR
jgi:hypothetical protein